MTTVITISVGLVANVLVVLADRRWPWAMEWWYLAWMVICTALSAINFATGSTGWGVWMAVCAAVNGWGWWQRRKRRKRKRTLALVGAKSRARILVLIRRQREAIQPT